MAKFRTNWLLSAAAFISGVVLAASPTYAGFKLMFQQDGYSDQTISDRFSGDGGTGSAEDLSGSEGKIRLGGALDPDTGDPVPFQFGTFRIEIVTGTSNSPGTSERGILDIVSVLVTNVGTGEETLRISMTDTGFSSPDAPLVLNSLLNVGMYEGVGTVNFTSYADDSNTEFGTAFASDTLTAVMDSTIPSGYKLATSRVGFDYAGEYSITNVAEYTLSANAVLNVSSGKTTLVTPAPPAILAFLVGLPLLGLAVRKGRRGVHV